MKKLVPHYEVFHSASGDYKVMVWDSSAKGKVIATNSCDSYRAARDFGRAWKAGKYNADKTGGGV